LVAESFGLVDESAAVAFCVLGVAAVELFAELVVGDAIVEDVVGGGRILWPVATVALACRRRLLRWQRALR
jgi:hypothetical protein